MNTNTPATNGDITITFTGQFVVNRAVLESLTRHGASNAAPAAVGANSRAIPEDAGKLPRLAYTMKETAEILGTSYITVHRLLQRGLLRSSLATRTKLIPKKEIERFLATTMSEL